MIYDRMTDEALADRLVRISVDVRAFPVAERQEILAEAAKRLAAKQAEITKFKERVRDRAIKEADRRGWCGEFDDIIREYGLAGRWSNYHVTVSYKMSNLRRRYDDTQTFTEGTETKACIARSIEHAGQLVTNYYTRHLGYVDVAVVKTVRENELEGQPRQPTIGDTIPE